MALAEGPMKGQPGSFDGFDEIGVLGEEAVARMDRIGAGALRRVEDAIDLEIALHDGRRADPHRLVGHCDMLRVRVGVGVDGDGAQAHPARGADDPAGDLAAIGDEEGGDHVSFSSL